MHGDADQVVPFAALAEAVAGLESAGVSVESHRRPGLGHGIDEVGLRTGGAFLSKVLAA